MKTSEIKRLEVLNKKYLEIRETFNSDTAIVSATQWLKNRMGKEYYELKKLVRDAEAYIDVAKSKGTKPNHYHTVVDYKAKGGKFICKVRVTNLEMREDILEQMLQSSEDGYDGQPLQDHTRANEMASIVIEKEIKGGL